MTKTLRITYWHLIFGFLISAFFLLLFSSKAFALTPEELAKKYSVTFPIADLGNCADYGTCRTYCEDPVNHNQCVEYAKEKGFYQEDKVNVSTDDFLKAAKEELGCDTIESCMEICDQDANFDKCDALAKKLKALGGYVEEPDKPEFLKLAKEILGCSTLEECATFCNDPANRQKCDEFADKVGLLGGEVTEGPGGCTTAETCQSYCSDPNNFSECGQYAPDGQTFSGPGGCDSPNSCRTHCEQNPDDCRSYAPGSNGIYVPVACPQGEYFGPGGVCTKVEKTQEAGQCASQGKFWDGNSCSDAVPNGVYPGAGGAYFQPRAEMGNCKTPGECYDYCKANPGKCGGFNPNAQRPKDTYTPYIYYTPGQASVKFEPVKDYGNCDSPGSCYDWCKENAGKCSGFNPNSPRPQDTYVPGTYYTPPSDYPYFTPPSGTYYVTPIYYTPPEGSNYTTPIYYTPGTYTTPSYYTPPGDWQYNTPTYSTPHYYTPSGNYPTPTYYTPTEGSNYTTPSYLTPPEGSNYTTPQYYTPGTYSTPTYYTPGGYYTPPYYTPGETYTTPSYYTPGYSYPSPSYYTPGYSYPSPTYGTPTYETPTYGTPSYGTPSYETPSYSYPTPSGGVQGAHTSQNIFQRIWNFLFAR